MSSFVTFLLHERNNLSHQYLTPWKIDPCRNESETELPSFTPILLAHLTCSISSEHFYTQCVMYG